MLQDVIHPPEEIIPTTISTQIYEFCDPSDQLFQETLQNSEVGSSSNCCYEDNNNTSYCFPQEISNFSNILNTNTAPTITTTTTTTTTVTTNNNNSNNDNISIMFDPADKEIENDISASIDFSPSPPFSIPHDQFISSQQEQFDFSSLQSQIPEADQVLDGLVVPMLGQQLPAVYEDECLSSMPSCSFLDQTTMGPYLQGHINPAFSGENSGIFSGGLLMGNEFLPQELDFQGDNAGIFCPGMFTSTELQPFSNESQHLVSGGGSSTTPLASESMEDSTYKVGKKLTVEERKEKIHRYMKKRNERNFSKKIKYACRKTLADSRPRVRGRFAKNDEFGENHSTNRTSTCNHEDHDTDEDVRLLHHSANFDNLHVVVKEEDEIASDIFAHISGVNSFKCNYPIQSWI